MAADRGGSQPTLRAIHTGKASSGADQHPKQPDSPVKKLKSQVLGVCRRLWMRHRAGEWVRVAGYLLGAGAVLVLVLLGASLLLGSSQLEAGASYGYFQENNAQEGIERLIGTDGRSGGGGRGGGVGTSLLELSQTGASASVLSSSGTGQESTRSSSSRSRWGTGRQRGREAGKTTAVCLVGAARQLEATGPSIMRHLVRPYSPADVFLHAPLDHTAVKLWGLLLGGGLGDNVSVGSGPPWQPRFAAVRIFANADVDESLHPTQSLRTLGSPQGAQGLLQYFRLVEGCLDMILRHQRATGVKYRWFVRARVDSFWGMPAPKLKVFDTQAYNIPFGSDFGGYNDRFGIGQANTAEVAMRRLSLLRKIHKANASIAYNSEGAYMMQFAVSRVTVVRRHVPFCVLTHRWPRPYGQCNPAIVGMESAMLMPLDGSKCLPCQLCGEKQADDVMVPLYRNMGLAKRGEGIWANSDKVRICNLSGVYTEGVWQRRFDAAVGPDLALHRQTIANATLGDCIRMFTMMRNLTLRWDAPDPKVLCFRRSLGPAMRLGSHSGSYPTLVKLLSPHSIVVSVRPRPEGGDLSWDNAVFRRLGVTINAWPRAKLKTLPHSLAKMRAKRVDVLKLPSDGFQFLLKWIRKQYHPPVCQVLVSVPKAPASSIRGVPQGLLGAWEHLAGHGLVRNRVEYAGFELDSCVGAQGNTPMRCLFFSLRHC